MKKKGFTLIELLVSIGILIILFGLGLINYLGFQDRQKMIQARLVIKEVVADAQHSARSGRISTCSELEAYRINFSNSDGTGRLTLTAQCTGSNDGESRIYDLPTGVSFSSTPVPLYAMPVTGVIDTNTDIEQSLLAPLSVTLTGPTTNDYIFTIDNTGAVSQFTSP